MLILVRNVGFFSRVVFVIPKHKLPASIRHLVPGTFLLVLVLLALCSLLPAALSVVGGPIVRAPWSVVPLLAPCSLLVAYGFAVLLASLLTAAKTEWKLFWILPLVFPCYHFGYGWGFLRGMIWKLITRSCEVNG